MEFKICRTALSQARGLMFSSKKNLIFVLDPERRQSLHMFFVFFPIDVFYLDSAKKIVEIKRDFKPFTVYMPSKKAKYIAEIAKDKEKFKKIKIGKKFIFSF